MAITPGAGYMVDPNNANGVVPIGTSTNTPQTAATAPVTPAPVPTTPAIPTATPVAPTTTATPATQTPSATQPPQTQTTAPNQPALTMPTNGSVVDLLNMAGQDSSFAARQNLAKQFGIQGYTGTATQNTDLSKKYLDAYNANKGTPTPQSAAQAQSATDQYFQDNTKQPPEDPQRAFFDNYMNMNPVVKNLYDTINQTLSSIGTQQTFTQQYQDLVAQQGIPGVQTDLMNINNIMKGTEDDIRNEITKAGGFATESQVQALTGARNKTLLVQANSLQQQLQQKEDYVNQIMQFSQLDRSEVDKQVDQKLGLTQKLADIQTQITNAAKDNYQKIVDTAGYQGLSSSLVGDPQGQKLAEQSLGLPSGSLSPGSSFLASQPSVAKPFQFVNGTANQASGTFDPNTGQFQPTGNSIPAGNNSNQSSTQDAVSVVGGNGVLVAGIKVDPTIANDVQAVLEGRNTLYNIRQTMGRTNAAAAYMQKMRDTISKIDPNFDFVASDAGGKFVSSTFYQKATSAITSVLPNIDKAVELSDQVNRIGVKGVDTLLQKGAIQIGNQKVTNFHEAQKLIADEIGLALGQGTVSDMKLQLGFDVTDPAVTPEVFASNMGIVKDFINNRLAALKNQRYTSSVGATQLPSDIESKINSNLTFSDDKKTAYLPRDVWSTLGPNMDAVLADAKAHGINLLIK